MTTLETALRNFQAKVFPSQEALHKYLREHPQADPGAHSVKENAKEEPQKHKPDIILNKHLENVSWAGDSVKRLRKQLEGTSDQEVDPKMVDKALAELKTESKNLKNPKHRQETAALAAERLQRYKIREASLKTVLNTFKAAKLTLNEDQKLKSDLDAFMKAASPKMAGNPIYDKILDLMEELVKKHHQSPDQLGNNLAYALKRRLEKGN